MANIFLDLTLQGEKIEYESTKKVGEGTIGGVDISKKIPVSSASWNFSRPWTPESGGSGGTVSPGDINMVLEEGIYMAKLQQGFYDSKQVEGIVHFFAAGKEKDVEGSTEFMTVEFKGGITTSWSIGIHGGVTASDGDANVSFTFTYFKTTYNPGNVGAVYDYKARK